MKLKIVKLLESILPAIAYRAVLSSYTNCKSIYRYYTQIPKMHSVYGSWFSLLYFPIIGGVLGVERSLDMPRKYWATLPWVTKIFAYGADVTWSNETVSVRYNGLALCASAIDESLHTVFFETFEVDEYGIGSRNFDGMTVLDVGANIGDTAAFFMSRGASKIYSFEPLPSVFKYLNKTVVENGFSESIETHCVGLSDKNEHIDIWIRDGASAGSSVITSGVDSLINDPLYRSEGIELVDAEEYLVSHNIKKIDVIKMDCEHCEYRLFRTGNILNMLDPELIFLEYHAGAKPIVKLFEKHGYKVEVTEKNKRVGVIVASRTARPATIHST